jgi:hypothetical protein
LGLALATKPSAAKSFTWDGETVRQSEAAFPLAAAKQPFSLDFAEQSESNSRFSMALPHLPIVRRETNLKQNCQGSSEF